MIPDRLIVEPGGLLRGRLRVPGDKSISHRAVMFASIADGVSEIDGALLGEDVVATIDAFRQMGVSIDCASDGRLTIVGRGVDGLNDPDGVLDMGNSGTSIRLLSGILSGAGVTAELTGDASLLRRPMRRVTDPLIQMGARIETGENGKPPLKIHGGGALHAIDYAMPMASAQVKSAVLLAGLFASGTTSVTEPAVTRDHTERMLGAFTVEVKTKGSTISLRGGQRLKATKIAVPSDISSAAFFLVGAAICPGQQMTIENVGVNPTRTGIIDILRLMGADIELSEQRFVGAEPVADVTVSGGPLHGIDIPEHLVPLAIDEFPVIFIAAASAEGTTRLSGASELRVKESDRIAVMANGLKTLGVVAEPRPDGIEIHGQPGFGGGAIHSDGDHRIAMAFAISALRAARPIEITGASAIATSFPEFVTLAQSTGLNIQS